MRWDGLGEWSARSLASARVYREGGAWEGFDLKGEGRGARKKSGGAEEGEERMEGTVLLPASRRGEGGI